MKLIAATIAALTITTAANAATVTLITADSSNTKTMTVPLTCQDVAVQYFSNLVSFMKPLKDGFSDQMRGWYVYDVQNGNNFTVATCVETPNFS